mmetsp:Transcript_98844/g.249615  ORF Transcript_98844/g.249615 Transcript_98844/m.249615 type:complete len:272 (-) Transcript_98844:181-996(-)
MSASNANFTSWAAMYKLTQGNAVQCDDGAARNGHASGIDHQLCLWLIPFAKTIDKTIFVHPQELTRASASQACHVTHVYFSIPFLLVTHEREISCPSRVWEICTGRPCLIDAKILALRVPDAEDCPLSQLCRAAHSFEGPHGLLVEGMAMPIDDALPLILAHIASLQPCPDREWDAKLNWLLHFLYLCELEFLEFWQDLWQSVRLLLHQGLRDLDHFLLHPSSPLRSFLSLAIHLHQLGPTEIEQQVERTKEEKEESWIPSRIRRRALLVF